MYVPSILTQGQVLYRDTWYPYGPVAPYLNSLLFQIFGVHLNVLSLAGLVSLLVSALALYFVALRLACRAAAFIVACGVMLQSFRPHIFNFPLPYSFAAVYGALLSSLFLMFAVRAAFQASRVHVFWAGLLASLALLTKLELGFACYVSLGGLLVGRWLRDRSWPALLYDVALTLPGVLLCGVTVLWMVSLGGLTFLTQENIMSWPTSHFMRMYGQHWLQHVGFDLSSETILHALAGSLIFFVFWIGVRVGLNCMAFYPSCRPLGFGLACLIGIVAIGLYVIDRSHFSAIFFGLFLPRHMVFIIACALPVLFWDAWKSRFSARPLAVLLTASFAVVLGFRIAFRMVLTGYAIYYNGAVLVAFVMLLFFLALPASPPLLPSWRSWGSILIFVPLGLGIVHATNYLWVSFQQFDNEVLFQNERGTLYMDRHKATVYAEAIAFMRNAAQRGEAIMSIPEDTALYFLSGVNCPTRVYTFSPGVLAPGKMTQEVIQQMDRYPVRYLLISNRRFPEYGRLEFGVDFDQPLGEYIRLKYRPVRPLVDAQAPPRSQWSAWQIMVWERIPQTDTDNIVSTPHEHPDTQTGGALRGLNPTIDVTTQVPQ